MWYRVDSIATDHNPSYAAGQVVPNLPDGHGAGWFETAEEAVKMVEDINTSARRWIETGYTERVAYFGSITYVTPRR